MTAVVSNIVENMHFTCFGSLNFYGSFITVYLIFFLILTFGEWKVFWTSKMNAQCSCQILRNTLSPWCFLSLDYYLKAKPTLAQKWNIEIPIVGFNILAPTWTL